MAAKKAAEFMIVNRRTGKALQATGLDNGLVVEQAAPTGTDAQLWTAVKADGSVKFFNKASGKVLDVVQSGVENGTWAQTWEDANGESQQWEEVKVTSTYRKLKNIHAGKVLDIADMSEEDGAPAQIWEDVNGEGQQWKFVPAGQKISTRTAKNTAVKKPASKASAAKSAAAKKPAAKADNTPANETAPKAVKKAAAPKKTALKPEPAKAVAKVEEKPKAMTKAAPKTKGAKKK